MTANASFFFDHVIEIRLLVALSAIGASFILTGLFSFLSDVLTRLAGSAGNVRDGLTALPSSAFGTR